MAQFIYKAIDTDGKVVRGHADAASLHDLDARLKRMGLYLVTGRPQSHWRPSARQRLSRRELIAFCFHLEQLIQAGVPIVDALGELRNGAESSRLRKLAAGIVDDVVAGRTLSDALAAQQVFDSVFVSLIRAGESGGRLPEMLRSVIESLQWEDECAAHTRNVLLYPTFVAVVVLAATLFLMLHLVPQLKQFVLAMGQPLPLPTRALFHASDALIAHWPLLIAMPLVALAGVAGLAFRSAHGRERMDGLKLRLPIIGKLLHKLILARFANTLALLYAAGIPVLDALRGTQAVVGNLSIERGLREVELLVAEGQSLSRAFAQTTLFPAFVTRMLRTGESSGALDGALTKIAYFYTRDVRESVDRAQSMIEPLLTVILGALLAGIMLAVLGPVYDVIGSVRP